MLAVAPLRNPRDEAAGEPRFSIIEDEFPDLSGDHLLDSIDFDDLFIGMEDEDHVLPSLEIESDDIFAEFNSVSGGDESETNASSLYVENFDNISSRSYNQEEDKVSGSDFGSGSGSLNQGEEIRNKSDETNVAAKVPTKEEAKRKKSSKNHQGKRKVKVDWTPELHRRFVQAVEQLGVDKAVPSRILELMEIHCLTRHNIASHLQKYRSHRKHLLAREAEAASWTQRRQAYGAASGGGGCKREVNSTSPWLAPTIGFPPNNIPHHFRPLHVWGHPSMEQPLMHVWPPKHLAPSPSPPSPMWPPASPHLPQPPPNPSFWNPRYQRNGHSKIPRNHCFTPSMASPRFAAAAAPVPGIPPHAMYKVDPVSAPPCPPFDFHPSKESIDAAIGDVLSKPWLPLPLGLKPPSTDSVVGELHRQGVDNIPPGGACASTA